MRVGVLPSQTLKECRQEIEDLIRTIAGEDRFPQRRYPHPATLLLAEGLSNLRDIGAVARGFSNVSK
jgi:predicted component of type VI protein secretion system